MAEEGGGVSTKGGLQGESSTTLPKSTRFSQPQTGVANTQQSTQTVQNTQDNTDETNPDDSDIEEDDRARELRQARKDKQPRDKQPRTQTSRRRYTLEPGDLEDELLITEVEDGAEEPNESIFAKVHNVQEFAQSATAFPEIWCNAVRNMVTTMIAYQEQNHEFSRDALKSKERVASLTQQLKEKNASLTAAHNNEQRLRESRTIYRTRNEKLKESVYELQTENADLKTQLLAAGAGDPDSDPDPEDSDCEGPLRRPHAHRRATAPPASQSSRQITPAGTNNTSGTKSNNKYTDVKNFHGNDDDRHTWDSWKMHLKSKFMMSWELFETEVS